MSAVANTARYRIGVDIGGTFTDFVMLDSVSGRLANEKVLTTPDDPARAVLDGVRRLLAANHVAPADVQHIIHGTTLVANALIERKGVKTALVTTRGFADVLEIGLEWRYDTYDLAIELPEPLVPRALRFEIDERVGPDGRVIAALDEASVRAVAQALREAGVEAVGVCLLHAFQFADHEIAVCEILRRELPGIVVCRSSDVVPEIGEYERMSTTVANAYVLPLFERYVSAMGAGLAALGVDRDLYLVLSDGGTVHARTAMRHPIRLVQSGPAGGVQAATLYGAASGSTDVFAFDMGGTTAKACLIDAGEPIRSTEFEVARVYRFKRGSGLPLRIPVIDMIEIGAGGGSIARVDRLGLLRIGPDSASAAPGPACYGLGGTLPTVTDADLVLGYLAPDRFLGGDMRLDVDAARRALAQHIAQPLGLTIEDAAWAIHDLVNESMARAAAIHALEKARRITDYAMVAIGGAGPVHAAHIARKLELTRVILPIGAGVASAFGFLAAPISFAFVRGRVERLAALDFAAVRAMLRELEDEGRALVSDAGVRAQDIKVDLAGAMRYVGQGHEIDVALAGTVLASDDRDAVHRAFEAAYLRQFGRIESGRAVEIISWRMVVSGPRPKIDLANAHARGALGGSRGTRQAYFPSAGGFVSAQVIDRASLEPGARVDGPAFIEERESTIVVPPGMRARCDASLSLILEG